MNILKLTNVFNEKIRQDTIRAYLISIILYYSQYFIKNRDHLTTLVALPSTTLM